MARKYARRCPWRILGFRLHAWMHRTPEDTRSARDVLATELCTKDYSWLKSGIELVEWHANRKTPPNKWHG